MAVQSLVCFSVQASAETPRMRRTCFRSGIEGTLTQRVGRLKVSGFFFTYPLTRDGQVHTGEGLVTADNGTFSGGKATHVTLIFACGLLD